MNSFSLIRRNPTSAAQVQEILGLPDDRWSELKIEFGLDLIGTAEVTFLLTGEQTVALAQLAIMHADDDCATQRSIESVQNDLMDDE